MGSNNLDLILLVEDEEDHARLIKKSLSGIMNTLEWVKDGGEAIDYITGQGEYENAQRPGLILLDVKLPIKDGFEVLQELKSNELYKTIPIVMLTTTSNSEDVKKALLLGANDYIVKPIKFQEFVEKVRNLGHYWSFTSDSKCKGGTHG